MTSGSFARFSLLMPCSLIAAACQFDQSSISIGPKRGRCDVELAKVHPELLLQGTDLAEVQVGVGYDGFLYASHFDRAEPDARLRFITDNPQVACEEAAPLGSGTLRKCLSSVASVPRQIVAHPQGIQAVITEESSAATVGIVSNEPSATSSVPLMSPQEPMAIAIDPQQRVHFTFVAPKISHPGTGFSILHQTTGKISFRAYARVVAKRVGIVLLPDQLPWLFLGKTTFDGDETRVSNWVCKPDFARNPHETSPKPRELNFDKECSPLPLSFENAVGDDELVHVVGTSTKPGSENTVVYTSLTEYTPLAVSSDEVARDDGPSSLTPSPSITMGLLGPIIVHRNDRGFVVSRRVDGKWQPHEVLWPNPGAPKAVHDQHGNLHVFFTSDVDGDQRDDALYHFSAPPCID